MAEWGRRRFARRKVRNAGRESETLDLG